MHGRIFLSVLSPTPTQPLSSSQIINTFLFSIFNIENSTILEFSTIGLDPGSFEPPFIILRGF